MSKEIKKQRNNLVLCETQLEQKNENEQQNVQQDFNNEMEKINFAELPIAPDQEE